eukprot:jgi/Hompol1/4262/HPOL_007018-RA
MEWGSLEIGALIFTIILLIMLVGKGALLLYNGVKTTFQKTWLSTLILMVIATLFDTILAFVPGALVPGSRFAYALLFGFMVISFGLCQTELFKSMPQTVRIVSPQVITAFQVLICVMSISQILVAAASFPPLSANMNSFVIAQNIWLIFIAVITLAQPIMLMRFIVSMRDVSWTTKAPFYLSLVVALVFLIVGNCVYPTDNYVTVLIGDLCVMGFALFAILTLESAAVCQAVSKPKSSDGSRKKSSDRGLFSFSAASLQANAKSNSTSQLSQIHSPPLTSDNLSQLAKHSKDSRNSSDSKPGEDAVVVP